ncbi:MAG: hypothetical protein AAF998_09375 [Bacteroidota bacterium]
MKTEYLFCRKCRIALELPRIIYRDEITRFLGEHQDHGLEIVAEESHILKALIFVKGPILVRCPADFPKPGYVVRIADTKMSIRLYRVLEKNGLMTLNIIEEMYTAKAFGKLWGAGKATVEQMRTILHRHGFKFKDEPDVKPWKMRCP